MTSKMKNGLISSIVLLVCTLLFFGTLYLVDQDRVQAAQTTEVNERTVNLIELPADVVEMLDQEGIASNVEFKKKVIIYRPSKDGAREDISYTFSFTLDPGVRCYFAVRTSPAFYKENQQCFSVSTTP